MNAEDEVRALSREKWRWSVNGYYDRLADLFDDDLVFVHITGHRSTKDEWIELLRSGGFTYDRIDVTDDLVRDLGTAVALTGCAVFTVNGGAVYRLVYTEIYARHGNRWRLTHLHTTQR